MRQIKLNASLWATPDDFYNDLLLALEAPEWHGHNLDALNDSITSDQINGVNAPYVLYIETAAKPLPVVARLIGELHEIVRMARAERGVDVFVVTASPH